MTELIRVANVNHAFVEGLWRLKVCGSIEKSRNGDVMVMPGPLVTEYTNPKQRVLFHPKRDANPVFHLMESIWMLAGSNDMNWLLPFNSGMSKYAEPDGTMHGAYGHRWRAHFNMDQLSGIVKELTDDPTSRQAVLTMWDPYSDLNMPEFKDRPCNTHAYFDLRNGVLNMTVCCRSNDAIWGAYGANAVHFSVLQEVLAAALNVGMGVYRQFSNNFHLYIENDHCKELLESIEGSCEHIYPVQVDLCTNRNVNEFLTDCHTMVNRRGLGGYKTPFFNFVAEPLRAGYIDRKDGKQINWDGITNCDWKFAFMEWVGRRNTKEN